MKISETLIHGPHVISKLRSGLWVPNGQESQWTVKEFVI